MPRSLRKFGPVFVLSAALACGTSTPDIEQLNTAFDESARRFVEYRLPNSMARPPGFDLEGHLRQVEAQRRVVSRVFHSPAGVEFVVSRIREEPDELVTLAGLEILADSRLRSAIPTFEQFSNSPRSVVAEWARRYLAESATWP